MMTDAVKLEVHHGAGWVTLSRPEALHALNTPMCAAILEALIIWARDAAVHLIVIQHDPATRGFCAGGDIRMLAASGAGDAAEARDFFRTEYRMNAALNAFPKPVLALMDGVTMGGGVGLSVHGTHRVSTERTVFAMPETGIGLFPDVGGSWFLPRLEGELGTWLALTGERLKGADVAAAGIATHHIPSELIENLRRQIEAADFSFGAADLLTEILGRLDQSPASASYAPNQEAINRCFSHKTAEEIVAALHAEQTPWAEAQSKTLATKSPETIKVALEQLRRGRKCRSFEEAMQMEFRIGWRKVQSADFLEGVRAVIIDKDQAPVWSPATLEAVSAQSVARYFEPLGEDELTFVSFEDDPD
jgi:enoyl-CoA hydratase